MSTGRPGVAFLPMATMRLPAEIHDSFIEGFDSADLRDAEALLDKLDD